MKCIECDSENVIVSAVEEAEDGNDNIIRIYEINGENTDVSVKLFGKEIKTVLGHNEIKTFSSTGKALNLTEWEKIPE